MTALSRRRFVQGTGALGVGLLAGCGRLPGQTPPVEQTTRVARIGLMGPPAVVGTFAAAMADLGYVEGQNLAVEFREDQIEPAGFNVSAVAEFVQLPVDIIVASNVGGARAARRASETIPIVVSSGGGDLLGSGLVASAARPGGNITGLTYPASLAGKQLELLAQTVPSPARIGIIHGPGQIEQTAAMESPARQLGVQIIPLYAGSVDDVPGAFTAAIDSQVDGLVVLSSVVTVPNRQQVADLALLHRLPTMFELRSTVLVGGLMSYGPNSSAMIRQAAYYVDKILKGALPQDIPVEQPSVFDFVLNLKTAQALGLIIPPHVLLQATEVIQ